jgi:circadian clock protein KaiC
MLGALRQKVEAMSAKLVFIDSPDVFFHLLDNPAKKRTELTFLYEWLRDGGITVVMSVKRGSGTDSLFYYEFLEYMADCVIHLDQRVVEQVTTRRLRVGKYRGSPHGRNEFPFSITDRGVYIIPVTRASLQHRGFGDSVSSGVAGLDEILGGGYYSNSCTLITGSSGTGKTTFACSFVQAAVHRRERVLYLDFEESWRALTSCMLGLNIDLRPAYESGILRFMSAMPESQGIEEHLIQAFRAIEEFQPKHLVVDAISACRRMGSSHNAFDYLIRLIDRCKRSGITTLLTNLTDIDRSEAEITGMDLSSLIDTVIMLNYFQDDGAYRRELVILKSRGRRHSHLAHGFHITDHGIDIAGGENAGERKGKWVSR